MSRKRNASPLRWLLDAIDQRKAAASELGQTAIVAVLAITLITSMLGLLLVNTVSQSYPLNQAEAVQTYANRALEAGQDALLVALNNNPALAQCNTGTNSAASCGGIDFGQWNPVPSSNASGADEEYFAFGNPQPVFNPTTNALMYFAVEVVGAANDNSAKNHYLFDQETVSFTPSNGFLQNVWWSNYESYSTTGSYSTCNYNWALNYNISNSNVDCSQQVYFGPNDYLFGPVFTNDSVFVSGSGNTADSPSFGVSSTTPPGSIVTTADPNCQFVDNDNSGDGMNGGHATCANANNEVALYDSTDSSYGHAVEQPPASDAQLGTIAGKSGCLYSGPTQITFSTGAGGAGQMTVVSPDTIESQVSSGGNTYTWDNNNLSSNLNQCPNNGTAPIPSNGVVFVEKATAGETQAFANPFDDPIANTVTNVTSSPASPTANASVTLTATVTSSSSQISNGATMSFTQAKCNRVTGGTCNSWNFPATICSSVSLTPVTPATTPPTATATCHATESNNVGDSFSASYSGGSYTSASSANVGQTNSYTPSSSYGPDAQVTAGGCSGCYYGETTSPDAEGDAFVNGSVSGQVTVGTANNVIVDGNLTYADCATTWTTGQSGSSAPSQGFCPYNSGGTNDALGLIADQYVEVNRPILASTSNSNNPTVLGACASPAATCDPSDGTHGITIDAAVLALTQSFVVNNSSDGGTEGNLIAYGSIQQYARGPVGTFNKTCNQFTGVCTYALATGYQKHYTWDPLLDFVAPPSYLAPSTPPWTLGSVTTNPGGDSASVCPPLLGVYSGLSAQGVAQTGPAVTQYCSQQTGGLPGFPSSTVPSPPTSVTASQTNGVVTVNWTAPANNGGSAITGYTVHPNPNCSTCVGTTVGGSATSATISGMPGGSRYSFTVTATNQNGTSSPSSASNSVIIPSAPTPPTGVSASVNANGTVAVNWTASPNGSAITSSTVIPSPACPACTGTTVSGTGSSATITGLTPGTVYTFTVTSTNGIGTSGPSAASNSITAPTKPGAPTIGTATPGNTKATVTWTAPTNTGGIPVTGYVVTPYKAGVAQATQTFNSTATTESVTGLTNLSSYTFTVAAINPIGTGPASAQSNAVTPAAPPGAPTIGTATAGINSASVTWTAPTNNGGAPITGYVVTPYIGGTAQTAQTFNSTATTETVTGLTANTSYTFKVAAINVIGTGSQSGSSNSITTPKTAPGAPTIGTATSGNASVSLNWTAPTVTGGSAITGYVVTPYLNGTTAQTAQTFNSTATTQTVTGLTNGSSYTFTVAAINAIGTGAASGQSNAVTPATVPGAPTIGTATFGNASATVTWTAPASNGGAAITGYVVTPYKGGFAQATQTFNSAATTETVTGLTNGSSYTFKVAAINSVGTGAQSAASNSVTPATTPSAPTITAAVPANTTVAITWTAPASNGGSAITGYVVTPYIGGTAQAAQTFNNTATTETATGLTNGTAYTFTVAAINAIGTGAQSAASASVTPATTPGAPTIGTATPGVGSAIVTWTAPASNGGSAITGYKVTPYKAGVAQTAQTFNSAATTETVTGLANNTAYTFTVAAINVMGTGPASTQSNSVTTPTTPGTPTIGTATAGVGSATVTWTAPASNGGAAITGYVVTPYKAGVAQTAQTFNSAATTETVTGLANNTAYTFTVAAINGVGTGTASGQSNSVTTPTTPGAPTIGTATRGNASATVTWTAPASNGGSAITGYVVTPYLNGTTAQTAQTFNSTATSEVATGLANGSNYTFKVAAINGVGTGAQSAASNSVTPATTPGAPTGLSGTSGNASVSLSWTAPGSNGGSAITGYVVTPYIAGVAQATQTFNNTATTETATGLTNGTAYTFTVAAINGVGTGAQSAASASVTPATTPGAPTIGTATAGVGSATVTWTAPVSNGGSAITGYVVTPYKAGVAQTAQTFNNTATTETVTGLANNTAYTFTVAAINGVGTGTASGQSNSVTTPTTPGAPTIGTATYGNASATVTWTAPASNGGSAITGYVVTPYLNGTTAQTAQTFNSTATSEVATGLANGSNYTFKVAAINGVGTGAQSAASNSVTPATTPGAPTGLSGTSGNASVSLSWTAPGSNGGSAITGYVVTPYIAGVAQATQTFNNTATTETATGLTNGTAYTFTVAAINGVGTGAQSAASASVTPATTPGAPTIGTATAGVGSATVTWTAPVSNGGSAITGYVVTPYKAGVAQTAQTFNNTATTETVTGLANNTAYTFTVAAINGVGTGTASGQSNSVTTPTTPGAPTIGTATYGNASATVTWTAPASNGGSAITGYVVTPYLNGTTAQTAQTFNSTATSEVATGLANGSNYTFKVAAINGVGTGAQSAASNSVTPATTPGAPTGLSGTSGNASVSLSWTAPGSNGGSAITGYVVTPYIAGVAQATQTFNNTATTETATGLTNGTAYTFTVAAINGVGTGAQSAASASVTPATTPGAPTIGTATAGNTSATVTWTAPVSNGGSAITGYVVTPYIGATAQTAQTFNNTATTETVTGLTVGSTYTFKVAAINGVGTGAQSAASNSITAVTTPGAPTIGTATSANASASVTWTAPGSNGGSAITGYVVTPYIAGVAQATQTFNNTATTEIVTGLTNGTAYTFKVAAINGVGTGAQSAASNSATPATTPGAPTIGTATSGNASATITWTAPGSNGGSAVTGYVVTPYIAGVAQAIQTFNNTATTEIATGLTNGTAYTFTVAAINGVGTGAQSGASNATTPATTPGAPTIGTATYGNASATVTWTAPVNNGGSAVTGYVVTPYLNGTTAQTAQTFNSTATSEVATGLTNGSNYTFKVAAINGVGTGTQSAASNSVTPATTPGTPTSVNGLSEPASALVSWTAPGSNGGSAITGYVITPYIAGVAQATQTFNNAAVSETVTGLTNGTTYTFAVAAINGVGTGSQSAQSNATVPATVAGAPTIGTATAGNASVTLTWTAPASNGGSAITGYIVTPYIAGVAQTFQNFPSTATTESVTGLTNGTAYTFKVAAVNGAGTGTQSAASNSATPVTTPGAPTIGTATSGNASASVTWTAPSSNGGTAITGYAVTPYIAGVAQATQTFNNTATTETATGLTNGTAYTFTVAAINAVGTGSQSGASNSVTPATTAGAPTIGTATVGNASATVTWTAPTSNGGSAITGYVVTPYIGATAQTAQTFNNTATSESVTGLTVGSTYTFKVAAINGVGTGAQSAASNSITAVTVPGAPTIGTATAGGTGSRSASVTFTAPSSNGGSAITGYTVTATDTTNSSRGGQTATGTSSPITVTGLTANDRYTFSVTATNAAGTGSASSQSNQITAR